jgi:hypothetical protein
MCRERQHEAEFGSKLVWHYREYLVGESNLAGHPKTLWHYEGLLSGARANVPVVGFPFLRTATMTKPVLES